LEKKFWLIGLVGWFLFDAFFDFTVLSLIILTAIMGRIMMLLGELLMVGLFVYLIGSFSSWLWKKYKTRKGS